MTSAAIIREQEYPSNAELITEGPGNAEGHDTEAPRYTADGLSDEPNSIYRDGSLHVTDRNHELLAALLTSSPQIPHHLKNLTLSGSHGPHLPLPAIFNSFTEGVTGHLNIRGLDLSLFDNYMYEGFLRLIGSTPGRSGATSINLSYPTFRTITDLARLLTRCRSAKTVKVIGKITIIHGHLRMGETFASNIHWAQRKVFIGRDGEVYLFSIMLDKNVLLDKLAVLVISSLSQRTMCQLKEILRKTGPALHVLNFPLPPYGNPILISLYIHQCLMTLLIPANRWRTLSLRKFKLNVLMRFDQCIDAMNLGPIDAFLCHSAPALEELVIVLHVPDWSPDRMAEEEAVIWRMMPLCTAKREVLFQFRVIARESNQFRYE
ncbi:hypothetical protein ARMGADRAFT_1061649 [Armillaria gallica]|uniref:Uncharacterized protein n=1 Tax=Armillaria gallica TaxID=47427 RepID=A0A2H3DKT8_ARMGA|nr:hypothetical protein ARMGADRAFT_1061649 [Armillaria gallica]